MDLGIGGKTAIVCASSGGLGRACAAHLAEAGCTVVVNGRDADRLERTAAELRERSGAQIVAVTGDVTEANTRDALIGAAGGAADILVNNAGGPPLADFRDLSEQDIHAGLQSNMVTPIAMIQLVIGGMEERGFGRILNITSASVLTGIEKLDLSSGARAGLTAFLSGVARQVAPRGVTINNLLPGNFDTDRQASIIDRIAENTGKSRDAVREQRATAQPVGRLGIPEEFGAACAFLASTHAGFITGQNLLLDGGAFTANFP
ncbi:SDR family oxidoreductase [Erythrobacter sp. LQ02-29]|uniref:SDR family oxidoreductase n=1 Tax=Erythrobacter sp. LQ02-29 TaxID=2920384 RepID=UPI001F4E84A5|nr:SDR family oxidoreductase [Erythrobacter sp. LQ02-29]MCP9222879.1 SDR family oxidoreductase [Erythrobacter sp. LQ02-29]